ALQDLVLAIGQSLAFTSAGDPVQVQQELLNLRSLPSRTDSTPPVRGAITTDAALGSGAGLSADAGAAVVPSTQIKQLALIGPFGELEIVASNNGQNIVVAKQSTWQTSNDGGKTFPFTGSLPVND